MSRFFGFTLVLLLVSCVGCSHHEDDRISSQSVTDKDFDVADVAGEGSVSGPEPLGGRVR